MLMSDLLIAKKYLVQQLIVGIAVGVFVCIIIGNLYVIPPMVGVMLPFSLAFTVLAYDERDGWQQFRLALPLSRTNVIWGRYASMGVLALAGLALGLAVTGVVIAAATLLPDVPQLADLMVNFSWQAIVLVSVIGVALILVMLTIIMPLVSRFGMTKAVRYIPLLVIFGVVFGSGFLDNGSTPEFLLRLMDWMKTPEGTLGMAGIVITVAFALYALSGALSVQLYEKREF